MCGIFGVVNGISSRHYNKGVQSFIEQAQLVGSLRGKDSIGCFQPNKKGDVFYHKRALAGYAAMEAAEFGNFIRNSDDTAFTVFHNRAATAGAVEDANAHPFVCSKKPNDDDSPYIIGVHNGTLDSWRSDSAAKGVDVDSHWLFGRIAQEGMPAFEKIAGAFALVWYDSEEPNALFMARNDQRPLYFAFTKSTNRMVFASEPGMIAYLADRNALELEDDIFEVESGKLYKISTDNPRDIVMEDLPRPKAPATTYGTGYRSSSYPGFGNAQSPGTQATTRGNHGTTRTSKQETRKVLEARHPIMRTVRLALEGKDESSSTVTSNVRTVPFNQPGRMIAGPGSTADQVRFLTERTSIQVGTPAEHVDIIGVVNDKVVMEVTIAGKKYEAIATGVSNRRYEMIMSAQPGDIKCNVIGAMLDGQNELVLITSQPLVNMRLVDNTASSQQGATLH